MSNFRQSEDGKSATGYQEDSAEAQERGLSDIYRSLQQQQQLSALGSLSSNITHASLSSNNATGSLPAARLEELLMLQSGSQSQPGVVSNSLIQGAGFNPALQRQALLIQLQERDLREARIRLLLQQQSQQNFFPSALFPSLTNPFWGTTALGSSYNAQIPADNQAALSPGCLSPPLAAWQGQTRAGNAANRQQEGNSEMLFRLLADGSSGLAAPAAAFAVASSAASQAEVTQANTHAQKTNNATSPQEKKEARSSEETTPHVASNSPTVSATNEQPEMDDDEYFKLFGSTEDGQQVINETFPHRLYRMLYETEKRGQDDIVSFFEHGKAFVVHKPREFTSKVLPKYFSTARMASFQRQLNLYGFQRIDDGREKGGFVHQYFQKGRRSLCNKIRRQRPKSQAQGAAVGSQIEAGDQTCGGHSEVSAPAPEALPQNQRAAALLQELLRQQRQEEEEGKTERDSI